MTYQVIARKWRPQTFEEVTGQESITRTLRNAIEHDRLHHAYIFSGSRGVGKTTTARILAKALNCHKSDKPNPAPCSSQDADACPSCLEISESRSIDVFEFDAASHTGVDDIRDLILESININPARDRFKIFIIDEVHMLSRSSFNALLKTLEEPPPRVEFIMATTELHKLPDTITSRCQEFTFRSIPLKKVYERLKTIAAAEQIDISDEALREISRSGEGSMRDAQSNFDQVISFSGAKIETKDVVSALGIASAEMLTRTVRAIAENNPAEVLVIVDELVARGHDLRNFCRDLLAFFRDLLVVKLADDPETLLDTAAVAGDELEKCAEPFSEADLIRFFSSLGATESNLKDARHPRHILEIGLVKLVEMRRVTAVETLLERLALIGNDSPAAAGDGQSSVPAIDQPEKKTIESDISPVEVPFPAASDDEPALQIPQDEPDAAYDSNDFVESGSAPAASGGSSLAAKYIEEFAANFAERLPDRVSPVTSQELEHTDDNWLDAAFEKKLLLSGDDAGLIANANELAASIIGTSGPDVPEVQPTVSAGNGGTAFAKARETPDLMPETEEDDVEYHLELPENPTPDDLRQYAENHPLAKKTLRIFRGKIVEIKKVG